MVGFRREGKTKSTHIIGERTTHKTHSKLAEADTDSSIEWISCMIFRQLRQCCCGTVLNGYCLSPVLNSHARRARALTGQVHESRLRCIDIDELSRMVIGARVQCCLI